MGRRTFAAGLAATVLALAWFAPGVALARSFVVLHLPDGSWTLIDPATIEADGPIRRTWTVTVRRNILDNGPPEPGYVRTLNEFDCARGVTRWRRFSAFSRTGSALVNQENKSSDWGSANSSTEAVVALRVVCGTSSGDAVISAESIGPAVVALLGTFDLPPPKPASALDERTVAPAAKAPPPAKKKPAPAKARRKA